MSGHLHLQATQFIFYRTNEPALHITLHGLFIIAAFPSQPCCCTPPDGMDVNDVDTQTRGLAPSPGTAKVRSSEAQR